MKKRNKLSCFIITKNEEARLENTLKSVIDICDEIVVIDSGSIDKTLEIAKKYGCKIFHKDWQGYGGQKRFGEEKCQNDWVLNLDADEVLPEALQEEIKNLMAQKDLEFCCYVIKQKLVYPKRQQPLPFFIQYLPIRLYNKTKIRYNNHPTQDRVPKNKLPFGTLNNYMLHFSIINTKHLNDKMMDYAQLQAQTEKKRNFFSLILRVMFNYPFFFIKFYILRGHIFWGIDGIKVAHIYGKYNTYKALSFLKFKNYTF